MIDIASGGDIQSNMTRREMLKGGIAAAASAAVFGGASASPTSGLKRGSALRMAAWNGTGGEEMKTVSAIKNTVAGSGIINCFDSLQPNCVYVRKTAVSQDYMCVLFITNSDGAIANCQRNNNTTTVNIAMLQPPNTSQSRVDIGDTYYEIPASWFA